MAANPQGDETRRVERLWHPPPFSLGVVAGARARPVSEQSLGGSRGRRVCDIVNFNDRHFTLLYFTLLTSPHKQLLLQSTTNIPLLAAP